MFDDDSRLTDEDRAELAKHEDHELTYTTVGAPGAGWGIWCFTCATTVVDHSRIMNPWEVE